MGLSRRKADEQSMVWFAAWQPAITTAVKPGRLEGFPMRGSSSDRRLNNHVMGARCLVEITDHVGLTVRVLCTYCRGPAPWRR